YPKPISLRRCRLFTSDRRDIGSYSFPTRRSSDLRVLEEEKLRRLGGKTEISVDVRVICATNRDLKKQIEAGLFREDLYFRLNVLDRKSTRLNSSHVKISYAVFCLKKKTMNPGPEI